MAKSAKKPASVVIQSPRELPSWFQGRSQTLLIEVDVFLKLKPHNFFTARDKAKRGISGYDSSIRPDALRSVVAAVYQNRWYRITGNRRAQLWQAGELPRPDAPLEMKVFQATSKDDLNDLYKIFSTASGVEDRDYDRLFRVITSEGLGVQSKNLRFGFFTGALQYLARGGPTSHAVQISDYAVDAERVAEVFREEILAIDQLNLKADIFSTGVLAAAITSLVRYPDSMEIWSDLNEGKWTHTRAGYDAAGLINSFIMRRRGRNHLTRSPIGHQFMYRLVLGIVEKWAERKNKLQSDAKPRFRVCPAPLRDVEAVLEDLRKIKRLGYENGLYLEGHSVPEITFLEDDKRLLIRGGAPLFLKYSGVSPPKPERSVEENNLMKALSLAYCGEDLTVSEDYEIDPKLATMAFRDQLLVLHNMELDSLKFTPGVLAAALLSLKIEPDILRVWQRLNDDSWIRGQDRKFDSAGSMHQFLAKHWELQMEPTQEWIERSFAVCAMCAKTWLRLIRSGKGEPKLKAMPRELSDIQGFIEKELGANH